MNTNTNSSNVMDKLRQYALLMRLDKPIGILLLLWPTLWALWIASEGHPTPLVMGVLIAGVILMRSAGCVINDYADRDIDGEVERTQHRPLATGEVTPREALILFSTLVAIAFFLVLSLNTLTVQLAIVAVVLAVCYPYMKRYTYLPQAWLGLAFGWSVPMAFAAQTGSVPAIAWLLLIATVLWALAYDTMYAMVDRVDDLRIGIKSTAILFDDADRLIIGLIQGLMLIVLIIVGNKAELGWAYHFGLAFATALGLYQQYLIRRREPARCFIAFRNNGLLGACIFAGLVINYMI